ncbi:PIN domain-containing protein [Pseudoalteromonas sp. Cnat2-41]|uniref:PIN domain-containing protein n=1 Tax=unclassified Pseudoalteromonas TaxID=194690 RepID=UPI001EF93F9B|nr:MULTISPECIES: PIN domain-containing protein [unclassified Pseudoalteromonas]MCF2861208.1 PIN domain-containing protein [Pseudoalteromonas sp. CNAT2-18]MCG7557077.1 PIN domain-containing protein [Pseudoalteromonas sp. CNAT2-18.1]
MINLVIDTNIYRKNPKLDNSDFSVVKKLSDAHYLKVQVPYIVQREFQTQQREQCKKDLDKSLSGINALLRRPLTSDKLDELKAIKQAVETAYDDTLEAAENYFNDWLNSIGGNVVALCEEQALNAMEAYFKGESPLTNLKNREDIPDSFIVQSINKISSQSQKVVVIAEDAKVKNSFSENEKVDCYAQLSEYIKTPPVQDKLKDIDLISDLPAIFRAIHDFEENEGDLKSGISWEIGDYIIGSVIIDGTIPDDNNEATISSFGEVDSIELDLDNLLYYGSGSVGVPFELEIDVCAYYYIFKADYYGMEFPPSVSDHNDHYFEAEDEFRVTVQGIATVKFDRDNLDFDDFSNSLDLDSLKIDSVESIDL